ncbi:uncharacterized protein PpBr36_05678 [Pyricularia pennisetigena]|uniref:uncharacterized protein n=1 Tax=Pyricularia pennisetigena TaxID=1578925 RepID=UPI00114F0160|nr:uncharacterized protein PpBr36_05678 [Pyricularia pennisetigena]TLS23449.1 hypothetical protein PpBr36_05678 [Pyricularia pennisetigena]
METSILDDMSGVANASAIGAVQGASCAATTAAWEINVLNIVLLLPPAPAARVLLGRALAIFSFWSAAALRRMAVRAPPGGVGDEGRLTLAPVAAAGALAGEEALGED